MLRIIEVFLTPLHPALRTILHHSYGLNSGCIQIYYIQCVREVGGHYCHSVFQHHATRSVSFQSHAFAKTVQETQVIRQSVLLRVCLKLPDECRIIYHTDFMCTGMADYHLIIRTFHVPNARSSPFRLIQQHCTLKVESR